MPLSGAHRLAMLSGFENQGYRILSSQASHTNPTLLELHTPVAVLRYRLWIFEIKHGGQGRSPEEYRIQVSSAPKSNTALDSNGYKDLLLGFKPDQNVIVGFDRRWLEKRVGQGGGSDSVQVSKGELDAASGSEEFNHVTKNTKAIENGHVVSMAVHLFPSYLFNQEMVLEGQMSASEAHGPIVSSHTPSLQQYCAQRGFIFSEDLLARYIASIATKPFVILAGVSGTGKSKLAEMVAEFYSSLPTDGGDSSKPSVASAVVIVPMRGSPNPERFALVPVRPDWISYISIGICKPNN